MALSLNNLAALLRKTGRQEEAEQLYRRALSIYEDDYGMDHPQVGSRQGCDGVLACTQGGPLRMRLSRQYRPSGWGN